MANAISDLDDYASHFNDITTESHEVIIDLNAINPLSQFRETWQNAENTESEHHLSTAADTDDKAFLRTEERGQYTAGFMCQVGIGVRIPSKPTGDSEMRWGYYTEDANGNPLNGYYFGADSDGLFVARADAGAVTKVYQDSWNRDQLDTSRPLNPSGQNLDISDGLVFRIDFTYYGYGPVQMEVLVDNDDIDNFGDATVATAHVFHVKESTSSDNTNLPIQAAIESGGTNNDALDLFVGGRQFSVLGERTTNNRLVNNFRDTLSGVDDTKWYAAMSFKLKDGSDNIGNGLDYSHVLGKVKKFSADTDNTAYRWQIRRGTTPNNPSWQVPSSHTETPNETAFKVDTNSTDVQDGDGNNTGVFLDGGTLEEGTLNKTSNLDEDIDGQITNGQTVSLLFKAVPGSSGSLSEIYMKLQEKW